ncbi:protein mono-ADP-ribosyltransferase PARP6-like [Mercenaria mercenaria]|uniref:protein mono-ADP-ribosyltransferase PARP6-like n=1 Tax=Mercenaria mercenaria TaxID=6596 RepID=UPI00234F67AE|nr:protein mono-ADP-ribosyltransferase PARP6-like [Mercenaria mercenaria]
MHPKLYRDIENLIYLYGEKSVKCRLLKYNDEIDVELHIPLGFLDEDVTTEVWKVLRSEPLVVSLRLSLSRYLDSPSRPKVEVFKPSKTEGIGFDCLQVRKCIENFISTEWHHLHKDLEADQKMEKTQRAHVGIKTNNNQMIDIISVIRMNEVVEELVNIGFEEELARNALLITHGNIDEAATLILDNPHKCTKENSPNKALVDTNSGAKPSTSDFKPSEVDSNQTPFSSIFQISDDKNVFRLGDAEVFDDVPFTRIKTEKEKDVNEKTNKADRTRSACVMPDPYLDNRSMPEDLNIKPLTFDGKNAKNIPSIADGFLVQVFRYVRQRIPTMNEYCVICDEPHVFQNGAMLKPTVCSRELCVFAFQTLGVMADAAEDIATGAEVVDLLINMTRAASRSNRKSIIFDPFPTVVDPKDPCNLLLTPKSPDYDLAETVLDAIPPMTEMLCSTSLKQKLDANNPSVYPLIQWIITSNRSHIVKLPPEKQLNFMDTPHQFLLLSSPPSKEAAFQEAKKKHGSTFAFHGSSIENWHSIIRQGLKNASGTKLQMNGAAYGKGIYLSTRVSTSLMYSRIRYHSRNVEMKEPDDYGDGKSRFLVSSNITCVALCEVINVPIMKYGSIWVCPEPDHVCTRFFFVYEECQVVDSLIDTQDAKYLLPILEACGYKT